MGQKPLFYSYEDSILLFSTDIKQVVDLSTKKLKLNKKRVIFFLTYLCGPVGQTFFENIFRLPARKILYVFENGYNLKLIRPQEYKKDKFISNYFDQLYQPNYSFDKLLINCHKFLKKDINKNLFFIKLKKLI